VTDPVLVVLGGVVVKTAVRLWVGPNVLADKYQRPGIERRYRVRGV
jgi:hypothetical protein